MSKKRFDSTLKMGAVRPSVRPPAKPSLPHVSIPTSPPPSMFEEDEATMRLSPISAALSAAQVDPGSGVEITVVREQIRPHSELWRAFEIWTKNRIYGLDMTMRCFIVLDRKSGSIERGSPLKGFRLGGGRLKTESGTRVAYPFPLVGMEAMLTDGKKRIHTSRVERFLIRIRELHMRTEEESLTWEDLESR